MEKSENLEMLLRACLKIRTQRRVRARGLRETPKIPILCRPGPLTGRIFRQALRFIAG
jgi:hypothetical protein